MRLLITAFSDRLVPNRLLGASVEREREREREVIRLSLVGKMDKMNQAFEKVKILVGMEVEDELPAEDETSFAFLDDFNRNCTLSTKQRLHGFAICLVAGLTCTLLSFLVFFNPIKFGITFTFGNLLSLGSTAFLIGPKRQVTMMVDPVHNKVLTLLAIMLEFGALIWYSLSYIPFARSMVSKVVVACFDTEF
ncbi:hypothetical protein RHMOL_Rhmol08G0191800 [Rhododendron molle]|uniref:Uncharacterized protein n=1 Tax=Rhododendron molle TaxID=49168 RepID=A0ACC0MQ05_RHOML|nr:hypothetical protein RHMOL_Rhmol08G0191800 [Rhododendron molle]